MRYRLVFIGLSLLALLFTPVTAQPVAAQAKPTLRAWSAFHKDHFTNSGFNMLLEALEERGFNIQWVGGPEAIPISNAPDALRSGIIELVHLPGSYLADQIPALLFESLYQGDEDKLFRETGIDVLLEELVNREVNAHSLGYIAMAQPFQLGGRRKLTEADFTGLRIRAGGPFNDFVEGLGGTTVRLSSAERYIGLERGLIDFAIAPTTNFYSEKLYEVAEYLIYPPIWDARNGMYINLDAYNRLTPEQREVLESTAREYEKKARAFFTELQLEYEQLLLEHMEKVELPPAEAAKMLKAAEDGIWSYIMRLDPVNGQKLRELADKHGLGQP